MDLLLASVALLFSGGAFLYSSEIKKENGKLKDRIKNIEEAIKSCRNRGRLLHKFHTINVAIFSLL